MGWLTAITNVVMAIFKAIFGTDKPVKKTVVHPKPDLEVDDGKTDEERLDDFGL